MRDTWGPPTNGGWPAFDENGRRLVPDAERKCDDEDCPCGLRGMPWPRRSTLADIADADATVMPQADADGDSLWLDG